MDRKLSGYTLLELLVVMAVLGVLSAAAIPMVELVAKRSKERELKQALWEIRHAIDAYKQGVDAGRIAPVAGESGYPPSLEVLSQGVPDKRSGTLLYLLRRVPRDPFAPVSQSAWQSWGLRSYASSAAQPKAGNDVFDVYSLSTATGLNGIPYRDW
jgi:general secretion pathway protein G